jgi:hypothetical protein
MVQNTAVPKARPGRILKESIQITDGSTADRRRRLIMP